MNKLVINNGEKLPVYHKLENNNMVTGKYYYKHLGDIMIIYPAIDLSKGKIVRLEKGDFEKKTIYSAKIEKQVFEFEKNGSTMGSCS